MVDQGGRRPGREEILEQVERAGLNLVRFLYCDNDGMIRGKATARSGLSHRLEAGIGLTVAMQAFTILDHLGNELTPPPGKDSIALCRCGQSKNKPFCDGSHRACGFQADLAGVAFSTCPSVRCRIVTAVR